MYYCGKKAIQSNLIWYLKFHTGGPTIFQPDAAIISDDCCTWLKGYRFAGMRLIGGMRYQVKLFCIVFFPEFSQKQVGVFKCPDKRCECCANLLLGNSYTFKNVNKTFNLKAHFSCDSSNLLYIVICFTCGEEYTGETGVGETKFRDRVRVYRQHIRQPEYQKLQRKMVSEATDEDNMPKLR